MESILGVLTFLMNLFIVIMVFNLMVVVHELGHFWAARWRGLHVEKFQIWFGRAIWKKKVNGVEYGLGWIPAGGFVALPQMMPMEMLEGHRPPDAPPLKNVRPIDKIIVAFAGPLFSFLLAAVAALVVWQVGVTGFSIPSTTIGYIVPGSPAAESELEVGDEIVAINGTEVGAWTSMEMLDTVMERIAMSEGEMVYFTVRRAGVDGLLDVGTRFRVEPGGIVKRKGLRQVGISPAGEVQLLAPLENSPAALAGLQERDKVLAIDGVPVIHSTQVDTVFAAKVEGEEALFRIERGGMEQEVKVVARAPIEGPEGLLGRPVLGAIAVPADENFVQEIERPSVGQQLATSSTLILRTLRALISPQSSVSVEHLNGPIGIGGRFYDLLTADDSLRRILWFAVILNVNLAILNLMPFPVLDGGHITYSLIEMIQRRPVHVRVIEFLQTSAALLLLGFFLFITVKDVGDRLPGGVAPAEAPLRFEAPSRG